MDQPQKYDPYGGFSIVKIVLSDVLPPAAFHPDFPDFPQARRDGQTTPKPTEKKKKTRRD